MLAKLVHKLTKWRETAWSWAVQVWLKKWLMNLSWMNGSPNTNGNSSACMTPVGQQYYIVNGIQNLALGHRGPTSLWVSDGPEVWMSQCLLAYWYGRDKHCRARLMLVWVTVLVCQLLVIVFRTSNDVHVPCLCFPVWLQRLCLDNQLQNKNIHHLKRID